MGDLPRKVSESAFKISLPAHLEDWKRVGNSVLGNLFSFLRKGAGGRRSEEKEPKHLRRT